MVQVRSRLGYCSSPCSCLAQEGQAAAVGVQGEGACASQGRNCARADLSPWSSHWSRHRLCGNLMCPMVCGDSNNLQARPVGACLGLEREPRSACGSWSPSPRWQPATQMFPFQHPPLLQPPEVLPESSGSAEITCSTFHSLLRPWGDALGSLGSRGHLPEDADPILPAAAAPQSQPATPTH